MRNLHGRDAQNDIPRDKEISIVMKQGGQTPP